MFAPPCACVRGKNFFGPMRKKSPKNLEVSEIHRIFAHAYNMVVVHSAGCTSDAQQKCVGIFYARHTTDKDGCLLVTLNSPSGEVTML